MSLHRRRLVPSAGRSRALPCCGRLATVLLSRARRAQAGRPSNVLVAVRPLRRVSRFMAPETLSSQTFPSSDVWAAGVMAYQLLSG